MKNQGLKVVFGLVIFLFSLALAYFTANYISNNALFNYWGTIAIFAGAYVLIGIIIASIYSISLGFLFSADILIIHLLFQYYGQWADFLKTIIIGVILIILYIATAMSLGDKTDSMYVNPTAQAAPLPPAEPKY
jgi:hypothetical protein